MFASNFRLNLKAAGKGVSAKLTRNYCNRLETPFLDFAFCERILISDLSGKFRRMPFGSALVDSIPSANKMCFPQIIIIMIR